MFFRYVLVLFLVVLSGCASLDHAGWRYYGEAYLQAPFTGKNYTDYWVHPDRSWACEPPWTRITPAGLEHRSGWRFGLTHTSALLCGNGDNKPEIYWNGIEAGYQWGGW